MYLARVLLKVCWLTSTILVAPVMLLSYTGAQLLKSGWCAAMSPGNVLDVSWSRSLLHCAVLCRQNPACDLIAFCATSNNACTMMSLAVRLPSIPPAPPSDCKCFEKRCLHGGVEQEDGSCGCVDGYVGDRCQHLTADCKELLAVNSSAKNNVFLFLTPSSPQPFPLVCGGQGGAVVARRYINNENFNRSWEDYASGFGSFNAWTSADLWTGLRSWHYLTSTKPFILQVYLYLENGTSLMATFANVLVGEEAAGFPVSYSSSAGALGNSLAQTCFSTYDKDLDASAATHCAQLHGGGWWFSDCGDSNPTGPLLRPPGGLRLGTPAEAFWTKNLGNLAVWKVMMVLFYV